MEIQNRDIITNVQSIIEQIDTKLSGKYLLSENLNEKLPIDSLDAMAFFLELEEKYNLKISQECVEEKQLMIGKNIINYIFENTKSSSV